MAGHTRASTPTTFCADIDGNVHVKAERPAKRQKTGTCNETHTRDPEPAGTDTFRSNIMGLLVTHEAVEQKLITLERKHHDTLSELNAAIERHDEAITERDNALTKCENALLQLSDAHASRDIATVQLETATKDNKVLQDKVELFLQDRNDAMDDRDKAYLEVSAASEARNAARVENESLCDRITLLIEQVQDLQVAHSKELSEIFGANRERDLKHQNLSEAVAKLLQAGTCINGNSFGLFGVALDGVREAAEKATGVRAAPIGC